MADGPDSPAPPPASPDREGAPGDDVGAFGRTERPFQRARRLEHEGHVARGKLFGGLRASTRSETVTTVLLATNCAVFAAMVTTGVGVLDPTPSELLSWGALRPLLTRDGQPWRLLTACFLHVGLVHLAVNMFSLWSMRFVEAWFGHLSFAVLYLASGLCGSLASTAMSDPFVVGAGASGALFGVVGAVLGAALRWKRLGVDSRVTGPILKGVFNTIVINAVIAASIRNLDHAAHAGGFASGIVLGYALAHAPTAAGVAGRARRGWRTAVVALLVIVALVFVLRRPGLAEAGRRVEAARADEGRMHLHWLPPVPDAPTAAAGGAPRVPGAGSDTAFLELVRTDWLPYVAARDAELRRIRGGFPELARGIDSELARYRMLRETIEHNARAAQIRPRPR